MKIFLFTLVVAALLTLGIFGASMLPTGERSHGAIENINGIPFPETSDHSILVTENLAHTDVFLQEPVLAKNLVLEIDFKPVNLTSLSVGIREDSFWLSYGERKKVFPFPEHAIETDYSEVDGVAGMNRVKMYIPLTDKLQEGDRSIDLMFFATTPDGVEPKWELKSLAVRAEYAQPSFAEFKNYVRSVLKQERAL